MTKKTRIKQWWGVMDLPHFGKNFCKCIDTDLPFIVITSLSINSTFSSHISAAVVALAAALYISPLVFGTKFETSIMKEPRDLPTV